MTWRMTIEIPILQTTLWVLAKAIMSLSLHSITIIENKNAPEYENLIAFFKFNVKIIAVIKIVHIRYLA